MPSIVTPHDEAVLHAREVLLRYGAAQDAFQASLCTCTDPACLHREPETFPLHVLLQDVARAAKDRRDPVEADNAEDAVLRQALLQLATRFGLFRCDCDDPGCPLDGAPTASLADLAYWTYLRWFALAGTLGRDGAADMRAGAELVMRNLHAVRIFTRHLSDAPRVFLEEAIRGYEERSTRPWTHEARSLLGQSAAFWVPSASEYTEVQDALDLVLTIGEMGAWSDEEAALWFQMASEAVHALLCRDLAHPSVVAAAYAAIEPIVPLLRIRTAVAAGESGAPQGFYAA